MDREFFKAKILCGMHRAKIRGIQVVNTGWHIVTKNNKFMLDNSGRIYILGMVIEGMHIAKTNEYDNHNSAAARALGVSPTISQSFSNGFCQGGYYKGKESNDDEYFAFEFGRECAKLLGLR